MNRRRSRRSLRPATGARPPGRRASARDDPLRRQIDDMERALWREDPVFMLRVRRLELVDTASVLTVFALLASGGVLVAVGAATSTIASAGTGVLAMATACLVDRRRRRALRRSPRDATDRVVLASARDDIDGSRAADRRAALWARPRRRDRRGR
jgi:hypothetical protein